MCAAIQCKGEEDAQYTHAHGIMAESKLVFKLFSVVAGFVSPSPSWQALSLQGSIQRATAPVPAAASCYNVVIVINAVTVCVQGLLFLNVPFWFSDGIHVFCSGSAAPIHKLTASKANQIVPNYKQTSERIGNCVKWWRPQRERPACARERENDSYWFLLMSWLAVVSGLHLF